MERISHVGLSVYNSSTSSVLTLTFNRTNKILNKKLEPFSVCGYKNGDRMLKHRDHRHPQFRNSGGRQGIQAKCARSRECSKLPIEVQREKEAESRYLPSIHNASEETKNEKEVVT